VFLRKPIATAQSNGHSGDAVVKTVLPELKEQYGAWNFFNFAESDIRRTDEELRGVNEDSPTGNQNSITQRRQYTPNWQLQIGRMPSSAG
jgi:hypothetical protein